ncbi:MAG: 1-deoxy-D-xylulose-5-phosphate reductoisomerase [Alphaproteobacteria bacterium]|jgi:1-deoxy-D-xylulose-5-phosphate reductoisomerase
MVKKDIIILGATGTIGDNSLHIIKNNPQKLRLLGISAEKNHKKLIQIAKEFKPSFVAIVDETNVAEVKEQLPNTKIIYGKNANNELSQIKADLVINGIVGFAGLASTLSAISAKQKIALANKESIVCGWHLIENLLKKHPQSKIIPVDSEHNALLQIFEERELTEIDKVIITASGGPFFQQSKEQLAKVSKNQALNHPKWKMGEKISIDSATLMNKGFELIEAYYLFNLPKEKIEAIIHPESIIHAIINFLDGNSKAVMAVPNMQVAIAYAISFATKQKRIPQNLHLDLTLQKNLSFYKVDEEKFPALAIAKKVMAIGKSSPAILNASNEVAVKLFLEEKISFSQIVEISRIVLEKSKILPFNSLAELCEIDRIAREISYKVAGTQ